MASPEKGPQVGVIMGSVSDLGVMSSVEEVLEQFDVTREFRVVSAHRTPEWMMKYGHEAVGRGLQVIIAGAGGSAHLPGMIASETRLPVLGVAIESKPDSMNAALGSMVYMPKGIPLATMGRNEAAGFNAGLEAVRILALQDPALGERYDDYVKSLAESVKEIDAELRQGSASDYLAAHQK